LSDAVGALHLSTTFASSEFYKLHVVDYDRDGRPDPPSTNEGSEIYKLIVVDYDHDGRPDILFVGQSLTVLSNDGLGTFTPPVGCGIALERFDSFNFVAGDFNRDGHVDFAFSSSLGRVDVMLGLGYCRFSPIQSYATAASSVGMMGLRAADMNGDGQLDLVGLVNVTSEDQSVSRTPSPSISDRRVFTLLGNPDGTFRAAGDSISLGTTDVSGLGLADVTGDQRPDIVVSRGNGQIQVWENACQ
jgi:hypothetical protein